MKKVVLGRLLITSNASNKLDMSDVIEALIKHQSGQWGDISLDDSLMNQESLEHGGRVMSVWKSGDEKFWIISEPTMEFEEGWVTTVLLPSDY